MILGIEDSQAELPSATMMCSRQTGLGSAQLRGPLACVGSGVVLGDDGARVGCVKA